VPAMLVFRCTKRLIARLGLETMSDPAPSTGRLGDWYANTLNVGRARYVICLSERTLLPVILPARKAEFPEHFPAALAYVLERVGIERANVEREVNASNPVIIATTVSRVLLGSLNDFACNAEAHFQHPARASAPAPLEVAIALARMSSKPIGYSSPDRVTRELFAAAPS
jgi:hypothetical protein